MTHSDINLVFNKWRVASTPPVDWGDNYRTRRSVCNQYSWAVPTAEAVATIVSLAPIIEIGAGTGWWARLIRGSGGQVTAYDIAPPGSFNVFHAGVTEPWTEVVVGDTEVAARHPDSTLFLCWPPYDTDMAVSALNAYLAVGGERLVYIGEGMGGCCANDEFFEILENKLVEETVIDIPQWEGIHDWLTVYTRRVK